MRKMLAAVALAGATLATVATGTAHANPQDQQFFRALERLGFVLYDPPLAITHGHMICDEGLAHGVSWGEMHGQMLQWGYTHDAASKLAIAAIETYCPQYSPLAAQIARGT
jgi:hypothetical protein